MTDDAPYDPDETADALGRIAAEAGRLLAAIADRAHGRRSKEDGSPTTEADLASERLILSRLAESFPTVPVVTEESGGSAVSGRPFFLVDPLDGTRDYLTGTGEYSVNIALVDGTRPVAAAIASPAEGRVFVAGTTARVAPDDGPEAFAWRPIWVRPRPARGLVVLVSRRHGDEATEACLVDLPIASRRTASSAVKFGLVAAGEADLYVRCGPTMEWDTAAGDHIVTCAGGRVIVAGGRALAYGREGRGYLNGPFAAFGDPALAETLRLPGG